MIRTLTLLVTVLVVAGCATSAPPPSAAPAEAASGSGRPGAGPAAERTLFVSPTGDDSSPGTEARPLRTLQAAQTAVRALLANDARQNVRVSLASGTHTLATTLTLDQRDSAADGFVVRYVGPADASAVVTGGRVITGWERVWGEIHRAKLPQGLSPSLLFENDQRATLARTPNEGYLRVAAGVGAGGSQTQFVHAPGDLPSGLTAADATVYIWTGCNADQKVNYDWEVDVAGVKAIDAVTRTITVADPLWFPVCAGNRYFVQGARALLDRAGEFAVEDGYLYYWPRSSPIDAQRITAPALARLVEVKGASTTALARNIALERLTFMHADAPKTGSTSLPGLGNAAIHVENAETITIRSSRIADVGGSGIMLRGHAQRVVVEGDLIERVGVHGVWIKGTATGQPRLSHSNRIVNVRIHTGGLAHGSGSGIKLDNTAANEVANNEISDMPRYGISVVGNVLPQIQRTQPQLGATAANLDELRHAGENVVRRNDVSRVMTDSQDGGGIQMWGAGPANRIEENRVHDIDTGDRRDGFIGPNRQRGPLLHGIYADDGSDGAIIRANVVYGIRGPNANPLMIKGIGSEASGNVLVCDVAGGGIESSVDGGVAVEKLRFMRNVVVRAAGSDAYWFRSFSDATVAEADRNLFFHAGGSYTVRFRFAGEQLTLEQWRARYGFDKASITADPLFVDAVNGDYRVREGSPALALGFVNVDPGVVGLRSDYPFKR